MTQLTENPSPLERALIQRISDSEIYPDVQENAFKILSNWSEAINCRLAVEAMVSHRLDRSSILYKQTGDWIRSQKEDGLIIAVTLSTAGWPIEDFNDELLDNILAIVPSRDTNLLLGERLKSGEFNSMNWNQICEKVRVNGYQTTPRQAHLIDNCRRLILPAPLEARASVAKGYINSVNLDQMPALKRFIIFEGLLNWPNVESLMTKIGQKIELFMPELVEILTTKLSKDDSQKQIQKFDRLVQLTGITLENFISLSEDKQSQTADKLVGSGKECPWLRPYALEIYQAATTTDPRLLFAKPFIWSHDYDQEFARYVDDKINIGKVIKKAINGLSTEKIASVLAAAVDTDKSFNFYFDKSFEEFNSSMKNSPEIYTATLKSVIHSGKIDVRLLKTYLDSVGINDSNKEDIRAWLLSDGSRNSGCSELLKKYIIPNNLPARRLLLSWEPIEVMKIGYNLLIEDITDEVIKKLIPQSGTSRSECEVFFENDAWMTMMLTSDRCEELVMKGVFRIANGKYEKGQSWLEQILPDSLTENHPGLRIAIVNIALRDEGLCAEGAEAREFLLKNNRVSWFTDEDKKLLPKFISENWPRIITWESEILCWIPEDEQYQLFFDNAIKKGGTLAPCRCGEHLFRSSKGKERLIKWLLTHTSQILPENWLEYVKFYELTGNRSIRNQINNLIDHQDIEIRQLAMELENSYSR